MAHSSNTEALIAAKQDLLTAYGTVHTALGKFITLAHSSEPRALADALGSDYEQHLAHSPQQPLYPRGSTTAYQASYASRPPQFGDPNNYPHYPAPPQPHSTNPRTSVPPGPCFATVTPGGPRQQPHPAAQAPKARQRKPHHPPTNQSYASQAVQPLETDDDEDDEDDPEEPVSEDEHLNGNNNNHFYNPPPPPATIPTPPGSIPGGKKKRGKRERDPNAPKRPASAYILFQNAVRQEMRAANPTADYKELARQIGDRWKNLSDEAKRPWSEAGKLAMNSWNIQNKEYKISHPEITSPQNQTGAIQAPVGRKKRSRVNELDAQGNPLPKKRGRPTKTEKDQPVDTHVRPANPSVQQFPPAGGMSAHVTNGHTAPPAPQPHLANAPQATQHQHHEGEYSEEGEEEEEEEEGDEEEEEEEETSGNHQPPRPNGPPASTLPPPRMLNGPPQVPSRMAPPPASHSESELEEGEEDEESEARSPEPHHSVHKLVDGIQA